jgi:transcriptional repressor NrdR
MRCPYCGQDNDKVIDSRAAEQGRSIRRRRECLACDKRFTTYETVEAATRLTVIKKDGTRVPYDRAKMYLGLERASYKRPVSSEQLQRIVDEVEEEIFKRGQREVDAVEIGHLLALRLKRVDQVAYVRYASVYKQFRDLDDLLEEVREVIEGSQPEPPGQGKLFTG